MNLHLIDWIIVFGLLIFVSGMAFATRKYTKSVADFLAANRCAGRYLLTMSEAMQGVGGISVIALFQVFYQAGFTTIWWRMIIVPAIFSFLGLSGYIIYRYRQTRALTMAQFLEIRYNRPFRVYFGFIAFFAGIVNLGIFPAVEARFFIYFCGLPQTVSVFGLFSIATFPLTMAVLLSIALMMIFFGGQIAVVVTDFLQGMFSNIAFLIILIALASIFSWNQISEALMDTPANASMVNPFKTSGLKDFNAAFFLMEIFFWVYCYMVWQGNQGNNCSAKSPHEARMAKTLGTFRMIAFFMVIIMMPICAYTFMHHPDFAEGAAKAQAQLDPLAENIQNEVRVPMIMLQFIPHGLLGLFAAVMLAALVSTHDTYIHSFGSIFIQDVIMPFRKKPISPKHHMLVLKLSMLGVAVFVFMFSLLFELQEHILMFQTITGSILFGGGGICIVGGLYWKRGTTAAAVTALTLGVVTAITGIVVRNVNPDFVLNSMQISFYASLLCIVTYVVISLLGGKIFNMDRMLHRGKYVIKDDSTAVIEKPISRFRKSIGMGKEFTLGDKIIYIAAVCWILIWSVVFIVGTVYNLTHDVKPQSWLKFWKIYMIISFFVAIIVTVWYTIGGAKDMKEMFRALSVARRNVLDDGRVQDHHNRADDAFIAVENGEETNETLSSAREK
jgi:Na+/proline symporter